MMRPAADPRPTVPVMAVLFGKKADQKPQYDVAILGGGLAGMTAAYQAQKLGLKAIVLESAERLGGNAKTGYRRVVDGRQLTFPVGASVLAVANEEQRALFKEIGINVSDPTYKIHSDIALFDGDWVSIDPDQKGPENYKNTSWGKEFVDNVQAFITQLRTILRPRDGKSYFPITQAPKEMLVWDKIDLKTFLDAFPEKVTKFFAANLRSDISDDMEDISALAGIIDQGADQGERCLLPGGNYHVIRKMIQAMKAKADSSVKFQTHSPIQRVEEGPNGVTVKYKDAKGKSRSLTAKHALLAIPSTRVPQVMPGLPAQTISLLSGLKRGSYALLNIFLEEAPIQSNTYYKFPDAKWVADVVLTNAERNPDLPRGTKSPSVITCYIPIPRSLQNEVPSQKELVNEVIEEMSAGFPWLKEKMKGTRLTYYPEAMSAPAPGQMEALSKFDRQVSPHVRLIHSDLSGVFAARGAIDEALRGVEAVKQKLDADSRQTLA
jgi:protoporphyrinogen oxidase